MAKAAKEPTTSERLADVRRQREYLEKHLNDEVYADGKSTLDLVRLDELVRQQDELSRQYEQELRNPPKQEGFFGRMFRR
ncbi:MAG: hypothetical protein M1333_02205 [Patescibacteria group bacterium]|nr:hypothetical protein [Patescibacteria group bacterium]